MQPGDNKNNVLMGKNDWLYLYNGGQRQFDHLLGEPIKSGSVSRFIKNIKSRHEKCIALGIPYLHVVYPSKPVIMKEYLPENVADKVEGLFKRHYRDKVIGSDINDVCIHPEEAINNGKSLGPVFHRLDTHMTDLGSAIVAQEIISKLGWEHNPLDHLESYLAKKSCDLATMLQRPSKNQVPALRAKDCKLKKWDNRVSLKGNTGNIAITYNEAAISDKRLLVMGDSFMKFNLPTLATFFKDILYIRSDKFQVDLISMFKPDAIVTANAERYLCSIGSDADAKSVLLDKYGDPDYHPEEQFTLALRAQLSRGHYKSRYFSWLEKIQSSAGVGENTESLIVDNF